MKKTLTLFFLLSALLCNSQNYFGKITHRNTFFEGNSLSCMVSNAGPAINFCGGHYIPLSVYDGVRSGRTITFNCYAISGRTQTQINASISTNIAPFCKYNDLIVLWEGTNDMRVNVLSGAAAFANVVTYVQTVKSYGAQVIVCTVLARDFAGDRADLMTDIDAYNVLVRSGAATYGYTVCDLAADPLFDTRADASNATYYANDKLHQVTAGQDRVIALLTPVVNTVLAKTDITHHQSPDYWDGLYIVVIGGIVYYVSRKRKEPEYKMAA